MKIALFTRNHKEESMQIFLKVYDYLVNKNIEVVIDSKTFRYLNKDKKFSYFLKVNKLFSYFISIGGDGTILKSIKYVINSNTPIVGINTGRLGFLSSIPKDEIFTSLEDIFNNKINFTQRSILTTEIIGEENGTIKNNFALNEVTVVRKNTTSMITVETYVNNEFLNSYWSDGLIISTPTGSTGYSLSCGGPVIAPESKNLVITPIAPHNLSARPLVIRDDAEIRLKISGREDQFLLSLDSDIYTISNESEIKIRLHQKTIKMISPKQNTFFKTLRGKLLWGKDERNR